MPFIDEILKHRSVSIVGLEKNTGKTECLNYILRRLEGSGTKLAITSIGVDGEMTDRVTGTSKPETELYESVVFITSEKHYRQKRLSAEILDISDRSTALGRLITARTMQRGKIMLSGPADTLWLKQLLDNIVAYGVQTTLVDGAISRLSPGSPAITESMILNTGAAVSANIPRLVSHTRFIYELINIPAIQLPGNDAEMLKTKLLSLHSGLFALDGDAQVHDLQVPSVFLLKDSAGSVSADLFKYGNTLYATGAVSDRILDFIRLQRRETKTTLIIRDFTRLFIKPETFKAFTSAGHRLRVLLNTKLLAVCVNPTSPAGYTLNSAELCDKLSQALSIPVYDIVAGAINKGGKEW